MPDGGGGREAVKVAQAGATGLVARVAPGLGQAAAVLPVSRAADVRVAAAVVVVVMVALQAGVAVAAWAVAGVVAGREVVGRPVGAVERGFPWRAARQSPSRGRLRWRVGVRSLGA